MPADMTCEVYIDQNRVADTSDQYTSGTPTALEGLVLDWGRTTSVEQPDTSTCTFTVADREGDADFLGLLHVGRTVDVYAGAHLGGQAPLDVAVDGGFEATPLASRARVLTQAVTLALDTANPHGGAQALLMRPGSSAGAQVTVPPAPYSTSASAWEPIDKVTPGEQWQLHVWTYQQQPDRQSVALRPVIFTSPTVTAPGVLGNAVPVNYAPGWYQTNLAMVIPAGIIVGWLGLVVEPHYFSWTETPGTWAAQPTTWADWQRILIDDMQVMAPPGAVQRVLVFTGRITDMAAEGSPDGVRVSVSAVDWTADLANTYVGDQPWLHESISNRAKRILALAQAQTQRPVALTIGTWPAGLDVSWRDVDSQPTMGLLQELSVTSDSVLWSAFGSVQGFYLWMEDPSQRIALNILALDGGSGLVVITGTATPRKGVVIDACDVHRDGVQWTQDVTDVITRVDLTWLEQTLDDTGKPAPTERTVQVIDANAEAPPANGGLGYGQRRLGYSTQLTSSTNGTAVANRALNRSRTLGWRLQGLIWDTAIPDDFQDTDRTTALQLLNGTTRLGLPVALINLPAWTPQGDTVNGYVEGGTYTFEGGRWKLAMNMAPAGAVQASIHWNQLDPAWRWNQFDPAIRWLDLRTVGVAA